MTEIIDFCAEFYRHRDEREEFVPIELNELIKQSIAITELRWKSTAGQNGVVVEIETEFDENMPDVSGNVSELRQ